MRDKRILMTGGTSGIGLAAAEALAARGARLAIVARDVSKARRAAARVSAAGGKATDVLIADLASRTAVRRLAADVLARYPRVDVLVNNAGAIHATGNLTEDGVETTWAVNHLAPFLLTTLLLDRLKESVPARVVTTAGSLHRLAPPPLGDFDATGSYGGFSRYCQTKLANILFTRELARRLAGTGVTANCFHPGFTATSFNRDNGALMSLAMTLLAPFSRSPRQGAETLVWLAVSPDVAETSGAYFIDQRRRLPSRAARDPDLARRLWDTSEREVRGPVAGSVRE